MMRCARQMIMVFLALCLLLVPVLASSATVAHEIQHEHHKAATHSSPLCSWFCGAGQGLDLQNPVFVPEITFLAMLDIESAWRVDEVDVVLSPSRGPPSLSS
jgi:hypothetical protein